jgi:hypothetical protein
MENIDIGTHGPEGTVDMNMTVLREMPIKKVYPKKDHEGQNGK